VVFLCREETGPVRRAAVRAPAGVWARAVQADKVKVRAVDRVKVRAGDRVKVRAGDKVKVRAGDRVKVRAVDPGDRDNRRQVIIST